MPPPAPSLAREVASPGGMTQAGLDVLDSAPGLAHLFEAAVRAAVARTAVLARSAQA